MNTKSTINHCCLIQLIIFLLALPLASQAQTDRKEAKLQLLRDKVARAETKVAAAEKKLTIADSLITFGELSIADAEEEFSRIGEEQKMLEKEYKSNSKQLRKLTKSKDAEVAEKAESDLKALEKKFNADIKTYRDEIKQLTRKAARGEKDIDKGINLERSANQSLREALKALELAQENYEAFLSNNPEIKQDK